MGNVATERYTIKFAKSDEDLSRIMQLRGEMFRGNPSAVDHDIWDEHCSHVMIVEVNTNSLVGYFRLNVFNSGKHANKAYSAQFFDLSPLQYFQQPVLELGRFCIAKGISDPDIFRLAWAHITKIVDQNNIAFLFGCSSFPGLSPEPHKAAFRLLAEKYLAKGDWAPRSLSKSSFTLTTITTDKGSATALPSLLRSYLSLGGRVCDDVVVDHDLQTLLVFTGLEVAAVPQKRAELLRSLANGH